jgi:VanZ family protein
MWFAMVAPRIYLGAKARVWLAVVYTIALQALSLLPDPSVAPSSNAGLRAVESTVFLTPVGLRDLMHVPLFLILGLLWCSAFSPGIRKRFVVPAAVALLLAAVNEGSQLLVPSRTASLGDLAFNAFGVALGVGVSWALGLSGRGPVASSA